MHFKKGFSKKLLIIATVLALIAATCIPVFAQGSSSDAISIDTENYYIEKVTSPTSGSGEADGLGTGDRSQSYCWASATYGDFVYIGSGYNPIFGIYYRYLVGMGFTSDQSIAILNTVYNGAWDPNYTDMKPGIFRIDTKTGDVRMILQHETSDRCNGYRMAVEYNDKLYFVGYGITSTLVEIDPNNNDAINTVYKYTETDYSVLKNYACGVRGLVALDDELIMSMAQSENGKAVAKMFSSTNPSSGEWTEIADSETFDNLPALGRMDGISGGGIWDIVEFNGSIYVSMVTDTSELVDGVYVNTKRGFAVYRGDKVDGTWEFTPVIGDTSKGAKYPFGLGVGQSGAGNLFVFGDHLYIGGYNDPMLDLVVMMQGNLEYVYNDLKNPASLYRMDADENIEMVAGQANELFPNGPTGTVDGDVAGAGFNVPTTQYLWRFGEHEGKLYIGTFDQATLLEYFTRLTNGQIFNMSKDEVKNQIKEIINLIKAFVAAPPAVNSVNSLEGSSKSADLYSMREGLGILDEMQKLFDEVASEESIAKVVELHNKLQNIVDCLRNSIWGYIIPAEILDGIQEILDAMPIINAQYYLAISNMVRDAEEGFDLYVSEDGVNFDSITKNGFNDKFNHGIRTFNSTENGLFIGTANPFYGAQVWKLIDKTTDKEFEPTIKAVDENGEILSEANREELFDVIAVTDDSVTSIGLVNEYGLRISMKDVQRTDNGDGTATWTLQTALNTVGSGRTVYLMTAKDGEELAQTEASFTLDILRPVTTPVVFSATVDETAVVNTPFTMTAVTNQSVTRLVITNEFGLKMGQLSSSYVDMDDQRVWTISMRAGTAGASRHFMVAGRDAQGNLSETVSTNSMSITKI